MKQTWNKLGTAVHDFKEPLEDILQAVPQSPKMMKRVRTVENAWKKFMRLYNQMDGFITPVKSVDIKHPWNDDKFLDTWQYWKEYLIEQHGTFMRSRAEVMALKELKSISENDPQKAIRFLEFAMAKRYANFFKVNEEELQKDETNGQEKKPTVFKR